MNKKFLHLIGHVISINAADQSVLLESTKKSNCLRVYADNKVFQSLNLLPAICKEKRKSLAERYPGLSSLVNREFQTK
jgi:hypothetical protein